jgi:hypothetical protein
VDVLKVNELDGDAVLAEVKTLYDAWLGMVQDEKRKIAESLIEKNVIGEGEIDITFSYQQQLRGRSHPGYNLSDWTLKPAIRMALLQTVHRKGLNPIASHSPCLLRFSPAEFVPTNKG